MLVADTRHLAARGKEIYARLQPELEQRYDGRFVAIEVESGDYLVGDTVTEASRKARAKHPDRLFYIARVGRRATWIHR